MKPQAKERQQTLKLEKAMNKFYPRSVVLVKY
jgi:hypothetical protein